MKASLLLLGALTLVASLAVSPVCAASYRRVLFAEPRPNQLIYLGGGHSFAALSGACDARADCVGFARSPESDVLVRGELRSKPLPSDAPLNEGREMYAKDRASTAPANIWPSPKEWSAGVTTLQLATDFKFTSPQAASADVAAVLARFSEQTFPNRRRGNPTGTVLRELSVQVGKVDAPLQLGVDESYELSIPADGSTATLKAPTLYGAMRGLESFSQLVVFDYDSHQYAVPNAPWSIADAPRFAHRGMLIDTARHFQPIAVLKKIVDSLAYAKFNTLHWHVVDSQSFPFESRSYPKLWTGAYSVQERYTQEDMSDLIEYARLRGVRVMVEFDVPGHGESWCTGYPGICPAPTCLSPLDPSTEETFELMGGLFGEVTGNASRAGIFPDDFVHLGGDEVVTDCWTSTPRIAQWMKEKGFSADDAYMYIVDRAHQIVSGMGRTSIHWEEVFNHFGTKLDPSTVIHIWLDHATLAKVVAAGYRAILSNSDVWYLDHLQVPWTSFYLNEPFQNIVDPKQQALVLGGEVCMWAETVDPSDIFATIWPRAAAAAERLWSPADLVDTDAALNRLQRFRCLLTRRGIGANPVLSLNGRDPPVGPGGCYVQ